MALAQRDELDRFWDEQTSSDPQRAFAIARDALSDARAQLFAGLEERTATIERKIQSAIRFQTRAVEDYQGYLRRGDLAELIELLGIVADGLEKSNEIHFQLAKDEISEGLETNQFVQTVREQQFPELDRLLDALAAYNSAKSRHTQNARGLVDFFATWAAVIHTRIEELRHKSPPDPWPPEDRND